MLATLKDNVGFRSTKVEPVTVTAEGFFGRPELQNSYTGQQEISRTNYGCLAVRIPDSPTYAPPAICNISKDGRIAAVGGRDLELFLWNMETGELAAKIRGHDIAWTASSDSTFFVTAQEDARLFVWDMATFQHRHELGPLKNEQICHCAISTNGAWVVVGGSNGGVYAWDVVTGQQSREFLDGHKGAVVTVGCFQQQGVSILVSCGTDDHTICCWDVQQNVKRAAFEISELENAKKMKYWITRDGAMVAAWCQDSVPFPNLVVVDTVNDAKNCVFCHDGLVREARFNQDGSRLISCGSDGCVNIWDTYTLECQLSLQGHEGSVLCCGVNDSGTRIVSSGEDCTVRVWNAEDGTQILCFQAQDEPVKQCLFSMNGCRILTCDMAGRVYVWSMHTDFMVTLLRKFADNVSAVAVSGTQQHCIVGCNNGRVMMWDVWQRATVWEYTHHAGRVESIAFNSALTQVVTAGADGHLLVLNAETGKQDASYTGSSDPFFSASFSPDDELLAAVCTDGTLLVYSATGASRKAKHLFKNNVARITSYVWTPNSKMIAGACSDGCVLVWNVLTGNIFSVLSGTSHATCCSFDAVGKLLAVGTVMGTTVIFNLETSEKIHELESNASPVKDVLFNHDTTRLTTICNRQAIVWDVSRTAKVRVFDFVVDKEKQFKTNVNTYRTTIAHNSTVLFDHETEAVIMDMQSVDDPLLRSYLFSDTRMVQSGTITNRVMCWSAIGNSAPDKFHTTHDAVNCVAFSNDDRLLAMGSQDGSIIMYDVVHNETVDVISAHVNGPCRCVRFSVDAKELVSSGADAKVIVWDWRKRIATKIYSGHFISIGCCDMSAYGGRVVSGDNHGMLCIWDKASGNNVQTLPLAHAEAVLSVCITSDGSTVASVGADGKASIWSVESGAELVSLAAALESQPLYCAFSSDGFKLAVTESNGSIMVWNVLAGCQWFQIYQGHKTKVSGCSWSADCRRLATCCIDSTMATWDGESGAPLAKYNVKAGHLTSVTMSPQALYIAAGSTTGTLSVINVPQFLREVPEPSFLYHWLSTNPQQAPSTYLKLSAIHPTLANVQDAQGWSIITHAVSRGNAGVVEAVLETLPEGCGSLGLISAVPFMLHTRVEMHSAGIEGYNPDGTQRPVSARPFSARPYSARPYSARATSGRFNPGSINSRQAARIMSGFNADSSGNKTMNKSFSAHLKKVAVELFLEKPESAMYDIIRTNALAHALNSKSSECVQLILDATAAKKVSIGSYHAYTEVIPSLAVRYPIMCYVFLAALQLRHLGDLEVPVAVINDVTRTVIRTASYFTNVKVLWQRHLKLQEESNTGPQPYAHVKANMVCLPYACALGKQSLLRTLVESSVPVHVYSTPTVRAVIKYKWGMFARTKIWHRFAFYTFYVACYTVFAILFKEVALESSLKTGDFWTYAGNGTEGKVMFVLAGYVLLQTAYQIYMEINQMWNTGLGLYFKSWWNCFDITVNILMAVVLPLFYARVSIGSGYVLPTLISINVVMLWFKILFYAMAFEPFGKTILMFFALVRGIWVWCLLLLMSVLSFAVSLMVLYEYQGTVVSPLGDAQYESYGAAVLTTWKMVMFQFDLSHVPLLPRGWFQLFLIVWSVFMTVVHIVLFPMLIALARDIYQDVKSYEDAVFLKGRATLIVEVETLMGKKQEEQYDNLPPYVHLLTPVSRDPRKAENSGFDRLEAAMKAHLDALGQKLAGLGLGGNIMYNNGGGGLIAAGKEGPAGANGNGGYDQAGADVQVAINLAEQMQLMQAQATNALRESESQLPAVLRQIDRLQRTVNNQELRLEGMVTVLRDIENLLRDQQPVVIHQESHVRQRHAVLTEAELEAEVKRLLGNQSQIDF